MLLIRFTDEVMRLSLAGIEAIFSCDDLQVASEDLVYDLILKWSRTQYPELEERQEILGSRLSRFIHFPYISRALFTTLGYFWECKRKDPSHFQ